MGRIGVGDCLLLLALSSPWANRPSFSSPGTGGLSRPLLSFPVALSAFFPGVRIDFQYYFVALPLLGGDPCRSVGDQPPVLEPRGDPTRLGYLSGIHPLLFSFLLYSFPLAPLLRIILSFSVTQGGAGSPPPLVEVNQAITAWSCKKKLCPAVS